MSSVLKKFHQRLSCLKLDGQPFEGEVGLWCREHCDHLGGLELEPVLPGRRQCSGLPICSCWSLHEDHLIGFWYDSELVVNIACIHFSVYQMHKLIPLLYLLLYQQVCREITGENSNIGCLDRITPAEFLQIYSVCPFFLIGQRDVTFSVVLWLSLSILRSFSHVIENECINHGKSKYSFFPVTPWTYICLHTFTKGRKKY